MDNDTAEDSVKVVVRMRPVLERERASKVHWSIVDGNTIADEDQKSYTFDHVYCDTDQTEDVYEKSAKDVVESAMAGYNGTIFAYGQTASGKTHTIFGTKDQEGIVQMALNTIFSKILEGDGKRYMLRMSCIEIYNEKVHDLLSDSSADLMINEFKDRTVVVGLREEVIVGKDGVQMLIQRAFANRVIGETSLNERSSRSHVILRFVIECYDDDVRSDISSYISFLNVVDLAGSESAKHSGGDGDRLKESGKINASLLALRNVINQLSEKGHGHVNFRDSKLTRLLKSSLGGNARTLIICTVSPTELIQTLRTVRFASCAKKIKNKPRKNWNGEGMLLQYIQTINRLKAELEENRKNETVELELMNKNIELSEEVERLRKCILSSQMLPRPTHNHMDRRARRQTWGGSWACPCAEVISPFRNSESNFPSCKNVISRRPEIFVIDEEASEKPNAPSDFEASFVAFTTLQLDDDEVSPPTLNRNSDKVNGTDSSSIKAAQDVENSSFSSCSAASTNENKFPSCNEKDTGNVRCSLEDLAALKAEIAKLKEENELKERNEAKMKEENENLKEELLRKERSISWLETQCDDADNKETELREQIYELVKIHNENQSLIEKMQKEMAQLKVEHARDRENLVRLEREVERKRKELRDTREEITSKDRRISGLLLELRRVTRNQENNAEKAQFGNNENFLLENVGYANAQPMQQNRYTVGIRSPNVTPVKEAPECEVQ